MIRVAFLQLFLKMTSVSRRLARQASDASGLIVREPCRLPASIFMVGLVIYNWRRSEQERLLLATLSVARGFVSHFNSWVAKLGQTKPLKRDPWFSIYIFFYSGKFQVHTSFRIVEQHNKLKLMLANFGNEANKELFFVNWMSCMAWGHSKCHVKKKASARLQFCTCIYVRK